MSESENESASTSASESSSDSISESQSASQSLINRTDQAESVSPDVINSTVASAHQASKLPQTGNETSNDVTTVGAIGMALTALATLLGFKRKQN
ncbi:LPXTG cell wall anchor domain-containing protein [Limosilactobacillus alvi]|uniref:LPXTG cell wall anchor domain-containing protein n=1 Tax=Limosilactobacillus alvi TaxID=990412 RepID=UPI00195A9C69